MLIETDPFTLAGDLAPEVWTTLAAGEGAKGLRLYDRATVPLRWTCPDGFERHLLIRRHRREPDKRAYDLVFCRAGTTLADLAGAAGPRWRVEECFVRANDDLGLDHCEARSWQSPQGAPRGGAVWSCGRRYGWHRHVTLVMAAPAFLARLVFRPPIRLSTAVRWYLRRRRHQAKATQCRYQRRHQLQLSN